MVVPLPRVRTLVVGALVAAALSSCGTARPTSTLVATGEPGEAPPTTRATTTVVPAGAAPTTTTPSTTAPAAPAEPTTIAVTGDPATSAPAAPPADGSTAAPAPVAPPTAPAAGAAERVTALFTRLGYPVTADEAGCLAGVVTAETLGALEQGGDNALVGAVTSNFVMALARCEPLSFIQEQDLITIEDYGVDAQAARCVTRALNAAAKDDPVVALAYYEGTTTLPAAGQQRLIDALVPCVGAEKAREIITT